MTSLCSVDLNHPKSLLPYKSIASDGDDMYTLAYISIISFFGNVFTSCLVYIPAGGVFCLLGSFPPPAVTSTANCKIAVLHL